MILNRLYFLRRRINLNYYAFCDKKDLLNQVKDV